MYLAIDIGGTAIKYAEVDTNLSIIHSFSKITKAFVDADAFYDYLFEGINLVKYEAIGISAPGVIDSFGNVLSYAAPSLHAMYHTNVKDACLKRGGKHVAVINDAKAAGYCEFKIGNGKDTKRSAYFIIGTGVGGCICDANGVYFGVDGLSGEFSCIPVSLHPYTPMATTASISALLDMYKQQTNNELSGEAITSLYLEGDEIATKVVKLWLDQVAYAISILVYVYNPEVICIGGAISKAEWFISAINDAFVGLHLPMQELMTTRIINCKYHNDANLIGAILYTLDTIKKATKVA